MGPQKSKSKSNHTENDRSTQNRSQKSYKSENNKLGKGALIMNDQDVRQDYLERQMALLAKHMVEDGMVGPPDLRTRAVIKKLGQMPFPAPQVMKTKIHNI